jgi:two-component system, NtrC family, response regulator AtoC
MISSLIHLLLVDDDVTFADVMGGELERIGYSVTGAGTGAEALQKVAELEPSIVLLDLRLPDMSGLEVLQEIRKRSPGSEVIMLTGHGTIDTAIESIRMGAFDYVAKPCPLDELEIRIQRALERQSLRTRATILERGLTLPDLETSLVGQSPPFLDLMRLIDRVAPTTSTVLVTGETGSGKEMVAKLLHTRGPRAQRPFVVVECAALQEDLLQSELFGHERGAFTGAERAKPGLFEVAHGGTIFLDEIGEVSQATQVKLLRVLDTGTFRHVGGTKEIRVDVRVVAATNRDLGAMVRQRLFREDLFYRLSTITIEVPPLRARPADIGHLAGHFVSLLNGRHGSDRKIGSQAMQILMRHDWPGNVRELLHTIESAMIICDGPEILPAHLPAPIHAGQSSAPETGTGESLGTLQEMERRHIECVLRQTAGHRGNAARILGISERNLYRKLRDHGLLD